MSWHIHTAHVIHGYRRPVKRCEQPDRLVATRARGRGRTGRSEGLYRQLDLRVGPLHRETAWLGVGLRADQDCLTHVLPRCLPTPTEEADGNGYGAITGRGGPSRPPPRVSVNLVPLLLTGVRQSRHTIRARADRQEPLLMLQCPGLPGFTCSPDHLFTYIVVIHIPCVLTCLTECVNKGRERCKIE
jgi:hypothetical protein